MQRLSEIAVNASIRIFAPARADASHSMPCPAVAEGMKVVAGLSGEIAPATGQLAMGKSRMNAEIHVSLIDDYAISGDVVTERTRFRFGPPDRGLRPPGDDPDVDSPVIVLSAPVDEPVPTAVDWTAGIEALQARFPDRPIYLYTEADRLIPAERMQ
jgi:hypothetical protein